MEHLIDDVRRSDAAREHCVRTSIDKPGDTGAVEHLRSDHGLRGVLTYFANDICTRESAEPVLDNHQIWLLGDRGACRFCTIDERADDLHLAIRQQSRDLLRHPFVAVRHDRPPDNVAVQDVTAHPELRIHAGHDGGVFPTSRIHPAAEIEAHLAAHAGRAGCCGFTRMMRTIPGIDGSYLRLEEVQRAGATGLAI